MYLIMVCLYLLVCLVCGVLIWILIRMLRSNAFASNENFDADEANPADPDILASNHEEILQEQQYE